MLAAAGWHVREVAPGQAGSVGLRGDDIVVGILDLRHAPDDAARIEHLLDQHRHLPILALAPAGTDADPHLENLLRGCALTLPAPLDVRHMCSVLHDYEAQPPGHGKDDEELVGDSPAMRACQANLRKFAPFDLPVLITGETGTGKEVAARTLHRLSARSARPFQAINCGALPAGLVQSELFGHERGAFTGASARRQGLFESAAGGTVFLDEIGDLPLEAQTNLLRVLQEGSVERIGSHQPVRVDVRVLAATHVDLERAVESGRFRRDLYYRLDVLRLHMPALRERGEDIELLARHFLERFRIRHATRARGFDATARQAIARFSWPGNVRELLNRVQRAAVMAENELVSAAELELHESEPADPGRFGQARAQAEREALQQCLRLSGFNVSACARRMQVSRVTVYRLCRKHGVAVRGE